MAFDAFALVLAMLGLGLCFQRLGSFSSDAPETLNKVVLYLCLPATILQHGPQLQLTSAVLAIAAVPWLLLLATLLLVQALTRLLRLRQDAHAVLLLTVPLGNTSFLGFPLLRAMLGEAALPYAVIYDQFGSFLIVTTFGLYVLARYGGEGKPTLRGMARRVFTFPPLWALAFAVTLMPAAPPSFLANGLSRLSDALLPLVMLAIGLSIRLALPRAELLPLALGLLLKLILLPALALLFLPLLGLPELAAKAVVLEAAMPPMITAAALAISHRLAPRLAAAMVGYGILLSLITLPAWSWLLDRLAA